MAGAVRALKRGGAAVFPTDTVTGIGCKASDKPAVRRVFALKGRPARKPLILFVSSIRQAEEITGPLEPRVRRLLRLLWPGNFTAVLPMNKRMAPGIGRNGTVGIRIPDHPVPRSLLRALGGPMATTSANQAGKLPEPDAEKAGAVWGERVAVVPGRSGNVPSTVADLRIWPPHIIREGAVSGYRLRKLATRAA